MGPINNNHPVIVHAIVFECKCIMQLQENTSTVCFSVCFSNHFDSASDRSVKVLVAQANDAARLTHNDVHDLCLHTTMLDSDLQRDNFPLLSVGLERWLSPAECGRV